MAKLIDIKIWSIVSRSNTFVKIYMTIPHAKGFLVYLNEKAIIFE